MNAPTAIQSGANLNRMLCCTYIGIHYPSPPSFGCHYSQCTALEEQQLSWGISEQIARAAEHHSYQALCMGLVVVINQGQMAHVFP